MPEHEKPRKPKYVPPRKPFRRAGFAALAGAAIFFFADLAKAGSFDAKPQRTRDADKPEQVSSPEAQLGPAVGAVDTSYKYITNEDGQDILVVDYRDRSGRVSGPLVPLHDGMGPLRYRFVGAERTVLVFENSVIITIGYNAAFEGRLLLMMDGRQRTSTSVEFALPEDCQNGNLVSAAAVRDAGDVEGILYFISRNGLVYARRTDQMDCPFATAMLPASDNAVLAGLPGGIAVHFRPGDSAITFLKADFATETIQVQERPLPGAEPPLTVVQRGTETIITTGGRRFLVSETRPGDFSSLELVPLPGN